MVLPSCVVLGLVFHLLQYYYCSYAGFKYHIMFSIVCINNHEKIDSTIHLKKEPS